MVPGYREMEECCWLIDVTSVAAALRILAAVMHSVCPYWRLRSLSFSEHTLISLQQPSRFLGLSPLTSQSPLSTIIRNIFI